MSRPLLIGALFASLALNVFIGGAFAGAHLAKSREPPPAPATEGWRLRNPVQAAVRTLPAEAQTEWRESSRDFVRTYGAKGREARRLARETMAGLGAEPFDPDAALAALKRARAIEYENRLAMDQRIIAFAAGLPADQRRAFGEALAQPPSRRGRPGTAAVAP